jgi:general secretion pathway protein D
VNTRNLDTFIKVKNGETRLLGGLLQSTDSSANSRVPFLGDIPGLGRVFTSGNQEHSRTDVLISLTPRIVKILDRPGPEMESFPSGTAESFGPSATAGAGVPAAAPAPSPPRPPAAPGAATPGPPL